MVLENTKHHWVVLNYDYRTIVGKGTIQSDGTVHLVIRDPRVVDMVRHGQEYVAGISISTKPDVEEKKDGAVMKEFTYVTPAGYICTCGASMEARTGASASRGAFLHQHYHENGEVVDLRTRQSVMAIGSAPEIGTSFTTWGRMDDKSREQWFEHIRKYWGPDLMAGYGTLVEIKRETND